MKNPNAPYCMCGCGEITYRAARDDSRRGAVEGEHSRYFPGHGGRARVGTDPASRVMKRVKVVDGCWVFTGPLMPSGYGRTSAGSRKDGSLRMLLTHRVIYEAHRGQIPAELDLDHLCRNRACCNPDHLEPVAAKVNIYRGIGPAAQNIKKTHCPKGHEYDAVAKRPARGKQVDGGVQRACKTCKNDTQRRRYAETHRPSST